MDAESVHAVITSPPYWGLRDYSDAVECVFGGEPGCEHEWGEFVRQGQSGGTASAKVRIKDRDNFQIVPDSKQAFCSLCGAWRGQFGLEPTPEMYVEHTLEFLRAIRRVLRKDGTVWWNIGDSYAQGHMTGRVGPNSILTSETQANYGTLPPRRAKDFGLKPKDLVMIPFRVALAAQADGWWVRSVIIWNKPNPMPESVRDRPTTSHEYVLLLTKSARYFYDADAIREPHKAESVRRVAKGYDGQFMARVRQGDHRDSRNEGIDANIVNPAGRNKRTVWTIATQPYPEAHFATFPEALVEPMILTTPTKCCTECGAGWERVVERGKLVPDKPGYKPRGKPKSPDGYVHVGMQARDAGGVTAPNHHYEKTTLGFRPTCSCDAETKPAVVVDCFAGKGTVARVARKHNRDFVMIEMNPDYIPMMKRYLALGDEEVEKQGETWVQPRMDLTSLQK